MIRVGWVMTSDASGPPPVTSVTGYAAWQSSGFALLLWILGR